MSPDGQPSEIVGLAPAAGYATRLQPMAGSKETITVDGRPLLTHLLERMRKGGCTRLRVTTREEKHDVVEVAVEAGAEVVLAKPTSVSSSILAGLSGLEEDAVALIGFPDTVWHPADAFVPLVHALRRRNEVVLGLFPALSPEASDNVDCAGGRVTAIVVKPVSPRTRWTWGIAAARVATLRGLEGYDEPGAYFQELAREGRVSALEFSGPYIDAGTREGLARLSGRAV